ncbi:putative small heat shock protein [Clavispora lusitaniae]|uniref:SHSP domain-containing protein n=3 Tax=Clavispora lusitaniae TaxID=36911 RepID=C4XW34_CLAL4|nr:uncharacterized protein CLUG_00157 [Clavispora lusitaniae ATCC 42720]KAF7584090.1 Hsp20/alpha crystallin family protein [Clavispora lusitaniae]EEQ36034.1 hypothetical protein CLUG_00157 [Clavispora lusitaniae ATCC 42720]OVF06590.1 putative small heat shock protein [Clavispora lusitaniae]QFZ25088.1 putative small heat shock protein [Clavispora lusitaniae]QFZ31609.1 putative small heat shock protein [Clavispora lusitaniae]
MDKVSLQFNNQKQIINMFRRSPFNSRALYNFDPFFEDPFYESFFHGDRRPRRAINGKDTSDGAVVPSNYQNDSLDFWRKFDDFKHWDDMLEVKEEPDKYLVQVKDDSAHKKDLDVKYHKQENQLQVTLSHKSERDDGENRKFSSSSSSTLSVAFEKPVKPNDISAEVGAEGVVITVPKETSDQENVVSIDVKKQQQSS